MTCPPPAARTDVDGEVLLLDEDNNIVTETTVYCQNRNDGYRLEKSISMS